MPEQFFACPGLRGMTVFVKKGNMMRCVGGTQELTHDCLDKSKIYVVNDDEGREQPLFRVRDGITIKIVDGKEKLGEKNG